MNQYQLHQVLQFQHLFQKVRNTYDISEVLLFTLCLLYQIKPQLTHEEDFGKKSP